MENRNDGRIETAAASSLIDYLKTVFEAAGLPWNSDDDAEIDLRVQAIVAETIKQTQIKKLAAVNSDIVEKIHDLFKASGAQPFSDILDEIRYQCSGVTDLQVAHEKVNAALDHLLQIDAIARTVDDFGYVYGYASDL